MIEGNERRQEALRANVGTKLGDLKTDAGLSAKALREEITNNLQNLSGALYQNIEQISQSQRERLDRVSVSLTDLTQRSEEQQDLLRKTVEERLDAIRKENTEKLDQMRQTVDEKLQSTLDQRLGASFQIVADRLEQVYKSMGEMQTLASGVGDLKRLLTNVKSRGTWGEVALGNLLEEMMAPDQFGRNVEIVPDSNQRSNMRSACPATAMFRSGYRWMPSFRSKIMSGWSTRASAEMSMRSRSRRRRSKREFGVAPGRSVRNTSTRRTRPIFAVPFLPTEGLFAEVVRRPGLVDALPDKVSKKLRETQDVLENDVGGYGSETPGNRGVAGSRGDRHP